MFLGLEGSANKLGVGLFDGTKITYNERKTYCSPSGEGFLPKLVARHHRLYICNLVRDAFLNESKISNVTAICFTRGPGMAPPLISVAIFARLISLLSKKPLVPVNHCIAHIEMGRFATKSINPIILYVSGGNTQIIGYSNKKYRILGETIDIALGNCLDRSARYLNLSNEPNPGYNIEILAKKGSSLIELPYSVKGMDIAFSGILSTVHELSKASNKIEDICFSLQETTFSMLLEISERALAHFQSNEMLIVGGVGCNVRLQEMMAQMLKIRNGNLCAMDESYCIDNGAMIAYTGSLYYKENKVVKIDESNCIQRFRTDEETISWR